MKISLVMATVGRVSIVGELLESLKKQTYQNFELIVVDQNIDERLSEIICEYGECMIIKHVKSNPGLSKARNVGLRHVSGDIIAFPDDDCSYDIDTLEKVVSYFEKNRNYDFLSGICLDEFDNIIINKFEYGEFKLNKINALTHVTSATLFVKKKVLEEVSTFDEALGAGAGTIYGAGEDTDFALRSMAEGFMGVYTSEIIVRHPNPILAYDSNSYRRAELYSAGYTKLLKKHRYSLKLKIKAIVRPLGGCLVHLAKPKKSIYYFYTLKGRIKGLM
ncbi:glycosyltransferase family 2 protein [Bacillus sp. FSL R5-0585]|uniref:glycosyltransferase family 2 protein n=1 Tax=Bacillus sp. FSL R5-0585 TaxID=2921650 RepID=UPI0030F6219D